MGGAVQLVTQLQSDSREMHAAALLPSPFCSVWDPNHVVMLAHSGYDLWGQTTPSHRTMAWFDSCLSFRMLNKWTKKKSLCASVSPSIR